MSAKLCVDIAIETKQWATALPKAEPLAEQAVETTWRHAGVSSLNAEVSIVLGGDAMIRALNSRYRDKDNATNVLSFPAEDHASPGTPRLLGDIILAHGTITREAREQRKPIEDHFSHLCVHGMLHLLGFDHVSNAEAALMEAQEVSILKSLGIANPYEANVKQGMSRA